MSNNNYSDWIGQRVMKSQGKKTNIKPFSSGRMVNTVKGIIKHPNIGGYAFTFFEDDSYVACDKCQLVD